MKHMILHMMVPFSCTNCDFEGRNEQTILQESIWYLVLVCYVYMLIYVAKIVTVLKNYLIYKIWISLQMELCTSWENWGSVMVNNNSKCM